MGNKGRCALCSARSGVSFHRFPKNDQVFAWKAICGFRKEDKVDTLSICSKHFRSSDFIAYERKCSKSSETKTVKTLKCGVNPSIKVPNPIQAYTVDSTHPMQPVPTTSSNSQEKTINVVGTKTSPVQAIDQTLVTGSTFRGSLSNFNPPIQEPEEGCSKEQANGPSAPIKSFKCKIQICREEIATPKLAYQKLFNAYYVQNNLRKKVRMLQQKNRRLLQKVKTLEDLVNHLKQQA